MTKYMNSYCLDAVRKHYIDDGGGFVQSGGQLPMEEEQIIYSVNSVLESFCVPSDLSCASL
jgi:hypothetical protein